MVAAAKMPVLEPGTNVLAFSNQFQIATRDEPMSIQRGVIAAHSKLVGRIGVFEASYRGNVYVIDAITNNPGAGGGVITTRKGELIAMIGKELRNELTNTWINYAIPFNATVEVPDKDGKKVTTSILKLVTEKEKYKPLPDRAVGDQHRLPRHHAGAQRRGAHAALHRGGRRPARRPTRRTSSRTT